MEDPKMKNGIMMSRTIFIFLAILSLSLAGPATAEEMMLETVLPDGVTMRCYYDTALTTDGVSPARAINAASRAYYALAEISKYFRSGFTLNSTDGSQAHDPDRTIEIIIGDPEADTTFRGYGAKNFIEPYFGVRSTNPERNAYDAVIFLPHRMETIRARSWYASGFDSDDTVLLGTMVREMAHLFNFYYDKTREREEGLLRSRMDNIIIDDGQTSCQGARTPKAAASRAQF
jgi:hypothetical protein